MPYVTLESYKYLMSNRVYDYLQGIFIKALRYNNLFRNFMHSLNVTNRLNKKNI